MVRKSLIAIVALLINRLFPILVIISLLSGFFPESALAISTADGFNPGSNGWVMALATQSDGKIIVGGSFTELGGQLRSNIGRVNPDGSLDTLFNPGASRRILAVGDQCRCGSTG